MPRPTTVVLQILSSLALAAAPVRGQDGGAVAPGRPAERDGAAPPHKVITAERVAAGAIRLDGRLDDSAWAGAAWIADFVQKMPHEGARPTDSMRIAILYDGDALYVGARIYRREPGPIQAPLSRRDNTSQAEHLWVSFDTYHDRRTAYSFGVTASGVRMDWYHPRDNEYDLDAGFDPVWEARAVIDSLGWTAEMRIPFSQLRFNDQPTQVWGFNADHWNPATSEDVFWIPVPTSRTGWSSWMGELDGISGIKPSRRLELAPYGAGNATLTGGRDPRDPFDDGRNLGGRAGADLKMGLGPNMTLDATVNPDFGQVEADPAVVNLSAFEVFFDEKRPFFTEGSQLLRGNGPNFFYSRRIGAAPRGDASGDFVDYPQNSTILGAAKVTGRLASGLSLGALTAVSGRETARTVVFDTVTGAPQFGRAEVAPLAAYGVARVQQEFGPAGSVVGATMTAVRRDAPPGSAIAAVYDRSAVAGGVDGMLRWSRGLYQLRGWLGFTRIGGDARALDLIQRSAVHLYQRPDAAYLDWDSTRTTLGGSTGQLQFNKTGGHWLYAGGAGWESPGYDPNDAGRLSSADGQFGFANLGYHETRPSRHLHDYRVQAEMDGEWDYGGDRQFLIADLSSDFTLRSFWGLHADFAYGFGSFDHAATRGGPVMATPDAWDAALRAGNAFGARTSWRASLVYHSNALHKQSYGVSTALSIRPGARWQVSLTPSYQRALDPRQYLDSASGGTAVTYGTRYLFGRIDRSTFAAQLRLNFTLRPDLTLDVYAEPFAASGRYSRIGELAAPRTTDLLYYAADSTSRDADGNYTIVSRGDTLHLDNPDFNVLSFRSNVVVRWEWRPGSTLYLVWQQNRASSDTRGRLVGPGDLWDSLRATGDNFLAVKISYWVPVS